MTKFDPKTTEFSYYQSYTDELLAMGDNKYFNTIIDLIVANEPKDEEDVLLKLTFLLTLKELPPKKYDEMLKRFSTFNISPNIIGLLIETKKVNIYNLFKQDIKLGGNMMDFMWPRDEYIQKMEILEIENPMDIYLAFKNRNRIHNLQYAIYNAQISKKPKNEFNKFIEKNL